MASDILINGQHVTQVATLGYDPADDMQKVKSVQKKFRDSFSTGSLRTDIWDSAVTGDATVSVAAGVLNMASGAAANASSYILSKETFTIPFRVGIGLTLSQRIANQSFFVEMVSIDPVTGEPDGLHSCGWEFDGVSATQAKYRTQNGGLAALVSAASTVPTTASGSVYEIEPFADECWWHGGTLDSVNARSNSYRRHQQIPDPNAKYKLRLRWLNGATAPASSTNAAVQYVAVQDYAELTAEITAGRGNTVAGSAIGVHIASSNAIPVAGNVAHDGARGTSAPVIVAGRGISAAYTTVATGDVADFVTTLQGVQIVKPWQIPELEWSYAAAAGGIINTTDVVLGAAAGTGLRRYITAMVVKNANAVATEVVLKDGSTIIWRGHLSASMTSADVITFSSPLKTTANAALNFACVTTGAQVYVNAQGYIAP